MIKTDAAKAAAGRRAIGGCAQIPVGEDDEVVVSLDDLVREGACRMIATALEAEAGEYVERFADKRGGDGKRLLVPNGRARERRVTVGSGTVAPPGAQGHDKGVDPDNDGREGAA